MDLKDSLTKIFKKTRKENAGTLAQEKTNGKKISSVSLSSLHFSVVQKKQK